MLKAYVLEFPQPVPRPIPEKSFFSTLLKLLINRII